MKKGFTYGTIPMATIVFIMVASILYVSFLFPDIRSIKNLVFGISSSVENNEEYTFRISQISFLRSISSGSAATKPLLVKAASKDKPFLPEEQELTVSDAIRGMYKAYKAGDDAALKKWESVLQEDQKKYFSAFYSSRCIQMEYTDSKGNAFWQFQRSGGCYPAPPSAYISPDIKTESIIPTEKPDDFIIVTQKIARK